MSSKKKKNQRKNVKQGNVTKGTSGLIFSSASDQSQEKESGLKRLYVYLYKAVFFLFVYGTGFVLPLYYRNGYFDMMEAKADLFFSMMKVILPLALILLVIKIAHKRFGFSFQNIVFLLFLVTGLISTVFSFSPKNAFSGSQGWHVGYYAILCLMIVFLALKDEKIIRNDYVYIPLLIVYAFETIMTYCDARGFDLLSMKAELPEHYHYAYFATLGNSNWYVGYLSLFVPVLVCLYLSSKKIIGTVMYLFLSLSGLIASMLIGSDGIFISIFVSVTVIIFYVLHNMERIRRFLLLLSCFLIFCALIGSSYRFVVFFDHYEGIGDLFFEHPYFIRILIAVIVFAFLASLFIDEIFYQKNKKKVYIAFSVLMIILIVVFLYLGISYRGDRLDSYRFELWKLSLERYDRFDLYHKLFGLGPELLRNIYGSMYEKHGVVYTVSHSEPVQILMTMGISGLIVWALMWGSSLAPLITEKKHKNSELIGPYSSLFAYLGQSFVNSATLTNLCILIILLFFISIKANNEHA